MLTISIIVLLAIVVVYVVWRPAGIKLLVMVIIEVIALIVLGLSIMAPYLPPAPTQKDLLSWIQQKVASQDDGATEQTEQQPEEEAADETILSASLVTDLPVTDNTELADLLKQNNETLMTNISTSLDAFGEKVTSQIENVKGEVETIRNTVSGFQTKIDNLVNTDQTQQKILDELSSKMDSSGSGPIVINDQLKTEIAQLATTAAQTAIAQDWQEQKQQWEKAFTTLKEQADKTLADAKEALNTVQNTSPATVGAVTGTSDAMQMFRNNLLTQYSVDRHRYQQGPNGQLGVAIVSFDLRSATLNANQQRLCARLAAWQKQGIIRCLAFYGAGDMAVGTPAQNVAISLRRCKAVQQAIGVSGFSVALGGQKFNGLPPAQQRIVGVIVEVLNPGHADMKEIADVIF